MYDCYILGIALITYNLESMLRTRPNQMNTHTHTQTHTHRQLPLATYPRLTRCPEEHFTIVPTAVIMDHCKHGKNYSTRGGHYRNIT